MAYQVVITCPDSVRPDGGVFYVADSEVSNSSPFGLASKAFYVQNIRCWNWNGSAYTYSVPLGIETKGSFDLSLNDASLIISAVALCWGVAWLFKRVLRAFGRT